MKKLLRISLTLLFTLILLLGFAMPLNPVGNWYQQFLPSLGSQQISDIIFLDSLTGYAVSSRNVNPDTASILKTTNGGDNWQVIFSQAPKRFSKVQFINQNTGFVCGGSGGGTPQLYKTTNAGGNWFLLSSFGCALWDDMFVLNNDTIWLVDDNSLCGGVFRTTDSGTSWQQQLNLGSQNPSTIYMYNARIGFVSSTAGLYKTTNSGINWFNASNDFSFSDLFFIDSLTGWKASGFIKKTTNGGLNWINQPIPQGGNILGSGAIRFMNNDNDTIWAVGESIIVTGSPSTRGILFRTTDGGNTWKYQLPDTAIHITRYMFGRFINNRIGWAYSLSPVGIHTTNGGDTNFITGLHQISTSIPKDFKLYQNYPNPFNPTTNIKYQIVKNNSDVKISVFDITGKHIVDLVNQKQNSGTYEVDFSGIGYSSGIYFYELFVKNGKEVFTETRKMILIK